MLGNRQRPGMDYDANDIHSNMAKTASTRAIIAASCALGFGMHQVDIKGAYLYAPLEETIYCRHPLDASITVRLVKSLYGLRQAGKNWQRLVSTFLVDYGFRRCRADNCVFHLREDGALAIVLLLYVDDILLGYANAGVRDRFLEALGSRFTVSAQGQLSHFVGHEIFWNDAFVVFSQTTKIDAYVARFGLTEAKSKRLPISASTHFECMTDSPLLADSDLKLYQEMIGAMNYLATHSRPDIATVVGILGQFMQAPRKAHLKGAINTLRYLKGTRDLCLRFPRKTACSPSKLDLYVDASFADDRADRRSVSGAALFLDDTLVDWMSRKQRSVTLSSTEAEYVAVADGVRGALFIRHLFGEVFDKLLDVVVHEDNTACMHLSSGTGSRRTRHIDVAYHFVRELVEDRKLEIVYIPTDEQVADLFTKPLGPQQFERHRFKFLT